MIIPTILEKDPEEILNKIRLMRSVAPHFQIDIVDPKIFNGETVLNLDFLDWIDPGITIELDLMVEDPTLFLKPKLKNVTKVTSNIKGNKLDSFLYKSNEYGYLTGISLNPDTTHTHYGTIIDGIDFVQFLGVTAGAQGRNFENKVIDQITDFMAEYPDVPVQVDGGLNTEHIRKLQEMGVTDFIVGSAIFQAKDPHESYNNLVKVIKDGKTTS